MPSETQKTLEMKCWPASCKEELQAKEVKTLSGKKKETEYEESYVKQEQAHS